MAAAIKRSITCSTKPASIAFSGAGFLICYHLGVAECLLKHGIVRNGDSGTSRDIEKPTNMILSGVSGGALVAAAICLSIRPEDGMKATMAIAQNARRTGGVLDHLHPGFSLVDQVETALQQLTHGLDEEMIMRNVQRGRLRIGLTDSGCFPFFRSRRNDAYVYVDEYESISEILAACVLSSYVPGLTGPIPLESAHRSHPAVTRAEKVVQRMLQRGAVKCRHGTIRTGMMQRNSRFWDGGLTNVFPIVDEATMLVTPFAGRFMNPTIKPRTITLSSVTNERQNLATPWSLFTVNSHAQQFDVYYSNARAMRYIALSSSEDALESWFLQGYDDATRFLKEQSALSQFSVPVAIEFDTIEQAARRGQSLVP